MTDESNRLFFALVPDEAVALASHRAARDINMKMSPGGRMVAPENYHLTVLFLGDLVPAEQKVAARQAGSLVRGSPFELVLDHASSFKEARAWWLGANQMPDALRQLRESLQSEMARAKVAHDRRRLVPHVTIVRGAKAPLPPTQIRPIKWLVTEFALMRTNLAATPARYETLQRWSLQASSLPSAPKDQYSLW